MVNLYRNSIEGWLLNQRSPNQKTFLLLNFFMYVVLVTVTAKLLQFQPCRGVAAVFLGGIPRHTPRTLIRIGATLSTFQRNNDPYVLTLSHNPNNSMIETKFRHECPLFHTTLSFGKYLLNFNI